MYYEYFVRRNSLRMKGLYCPELDPLSGRNRHECRLSDPIATGRAGASPRWSHLYIWTMNQSRVTQRT